MMYSYPYFRMPFFPPNYRRYNPNLLLPQAKTSPPPEVGKTHLKSNVIKKTDNNYTNYANNYNVYSQNAIKRAVGASNTSPVNENLNTQEKKEENRASYDNPIFEIFGIKLYFDDLLILGLLFFLYSEGVQDNELFLALILLLFS